MSNNENKRVVVTGVGIVSPLGLNAAASWEALIAGKTGIDNITLFDASRHVTKFAAEVKGFDPAAYLNRKEARRMDRFAQFAVVASKEAVKHANLVIDDSNRNDIGVLIGNGAGGLSTLQDQIINMHLNGPDRVNPFLVTMMIGDSASAQVSIMLGAKGPNFCATSACSSSADALGIAYETIKRGDARVMIGGGSEAAINAIGIAAFNSMKALSERNQAPQEASRPFDAGRDGFVIGEGGAALILEELEYARNRGAVILAEMASYGASGDAFHVTQPLEDGEGASRAMQIALHKAGWQPQEVDYINAHGTSTSLNDKMETTAIKRVFGEHARKLAVSSTKSMTGHLLGGAGALEAAICVLTLQYGIIPPTVNYSHPDPECDLDYVPNIARRARVEKVLTNSFGFGGHNSVLAFKKYIP
ncbi:MAG TPA: beta-ketoacyl-ACP synthase II [Dehalococcoidales bacterium]|nr:beta-ketoacyl-ACP synthase II [Dehalococcoidales bacterium]